jgi:hypothetical protein
MGNIEQFKIDTENEKFLDKISGIYKKESEIRYIQNMVMRKINESDFFVETGKKPFNIFNNATAPFIRYAVAASVLLFVALAIFFISDDSSTNYFNSGKTVFNDSSIEKVKDDIQSKRNMKKSISLSILNFLLNRLVTQPSAIYRVVFTTLFF